MKLFLFDLKRTLFFTMVSMLAANYAAASPYSLATTCSLPAFVPDKCMLTTRFVDMGSTKTVFKRLTVQVAPYTKTDSEPYVTISDSVGDGQESGNSFASLTNVYNIMVTCGKTYRVRVVQPVKNKPTVIEKQYAFCPAKVNL